MIWPRRALACYFLVATVLAQVPHEHHAGPDEVRAEFGSCDESGRHWAGHHAVEADAGPHACPICHHRLPMAIGGPPPLLLTDANVPAPPLDRSGRSEAGFPLRQRCRAPPRS